MAFDQATCWLVRPERTAGLATEMVDRSLVSTAWAWPGISDLTAQEDADMFLALQAAGRRKPVDDLRMLQMFSDRMQSGDVVVVPDVSAKDLVFGEVTGDYRHGVTGADHGHTRPTRWFGRLTLADIDPLLVANTTARVMIRRLPEQVQWQRLAAEVDDGLGRDVRDVPQVALPASGARTRPRQKAAPAKPQRVPAPNRMCPSCGLLRAPSLFLDGDDYCRDCA